jgi:ribose 5-phosphate isomerase B
VDGAGIGSAIAANKVPGIRAAPCLDEATARNSRQESDANVLTLGALFLSEDEAAKIVRAFLTTKITEDRHRRRVGKISNIERKYFRPI